MNMKANEGIRPLERIQFLALPLLVVVAMALLLASIMRAEPLRSPAPVNAASENSPNKLVFLLTTGLEDVHALDMVLQYATAAKKSGDLSDVVLLADGRGVEVLDGHLRARPEQTGMLARRAKAAGVRFVVAEGGLKDYGLAAADLDPKPDEVVADGAVKIASLIGQHYEVIHF
jgi:hypothetical protein